MKKIILLTLMLSGCNLNELYYSNINDEVDKMCSNYDLFICGDKEAPEYTYTTIEEIREYLSSIDFTYVSDNVDSYDYPIDGKGDCEDFVIKVKEDLHMLGMIDNSIWMYGQAPNREYHAWALIDVGGVTYLFDTGYYRGVEYELVKDKYYEIKIVMRF